MRKCQLQPGEAEVSRDLLRGKGRTRLCFSGRYFMLLISVFFHCIIFSSFSKFEAQKRGGCAGKRERNVESLSQNENQFFLKE